MTDNRWLNCSVMNAVTTEGVFNEGGWCTETDTAFLVFDTPLLYADAPAFDVKLLLFFFFFFKRDCYVNVFLHQPKRNPLLGVIIHSACVTSPPAPPPPPPSPSAFTHIWSLISDDIMLNELPNKQGGRGQKLRRQQCCELLQVKHRREMKRVWGSFWQRATATCLNTTRCSQLLLTKRPRFWTHVTFRDNLLHFFYLFFLSSEARTDESGLRCACTRGCYKWEAGVPVGAAGSRTAGDYCISCRIRRFPR